MEHTTDCICQSAVNNRFVKKNELILKAVLGRKLFFEFPMWSSLEFDELAEFFIIEWIP